MIQFLEDNRLERMMGEFPMNNSAMVVEWDDMSLKEIEESKKIYQTARKEGRKILDIETGKEISSFKAYLKGFKIGEKELENLQFSSRIFDDSGDRRLIWDATCPDQVKEASGLFKQYLDKGWRAYVIAEDGRKGKRVYGFDHEDLEIFFDETSAKDKLTTINYLFYSIKQKVLKINSYIDLENTK